MGLMVALLSGCGAGQNLLRTGPGGLEGAWQRNDGRSDPLDRTWYREWGSTGGWESDNDPIRRDRTAGWRFPDAIHIDAAEEWVRISDRDGILIEEILTDDRYDTGNENVQWRRGAVSVRGRWNGNDRLDVTTVTPTGVTVRQAFTLENRGNQLIVETWRQGEQGSRRFTWVYDRV